MKTKVIEMLYSWTLSLPDETKVFEAYEMLKSQGETLFKLLKYAGEDLDTI